MIAHLNEAATESPDTSLRESTDTDRQESDSGKYVAVSERKRAENRVKDMLQQMDALDVNDFEVDTSSDMPASSLSVQSTQERESIQSPGFESPLMVSNGQDESQLQYSRQQVKKAGELAEMLLETKRTFLAENNVVDPLSRAEDPLGTAQQPSKPISRSTYMRSERVKATLAYKYLQIEKIVNNYDSSVKYPGVEGVYNPLQIIRNRRIRAKYHEYPKPLSFKTTPLASTVFSSKYSNDRTRKPRRFIWAVELNELISDASWRVNHIHELKNSRGELWFPPPVTAVTPPSKSESSHKSKVHRRSHSLGRSRLHDKLFDDDNDANSYVSGEDVANSNHSGQSKPDIQTPGRRDRLKKRMKRGLKYSVDSRSTGSSESGDGLHDAFIYKFHRKKPERLASDPGTSAGSKISTPKSKHQEVFNANYQSPGTDSAGDLFTDVKINSVEQRRLSFDDSELIEPEPIDELDISHEPSTDVSGNGKAASPETPANSAIASLEDQLTKISQHELYMKNSTYIKLHYLQQIYPRLVSSTIEKIGTLTKKAIPRLNGIMIDVNDDEFPAFEALCSVMLSEIKSVVHIINDDYSIRVDNLLTNSDRLIGEINTSMSLEIRKIDEKLDKLNNSLFGNNIARQLDFGNNQKLDMKGAGNHTLLYSILENTIVVLLRLIWVVVNIYKFAMWIVKMVWKLIKLILF